MLITGKHNKFVENTITSYKYSGRNNIVSAYCSTGRNHTAGISARILAKVQQEKDSMKQRIDDNVPSFISWAIKPLAGLAFDIQRDKDSNKGAGGEFNVGIHLRLALSNDWVLMNDVVVEPEPEIFAQTDHIAIGPPGMFVIETTAWDGAFTVYKNRWKRKEGSKWVPCHPATAPPGKTTGM